MLALASVIVVGFVLAAGHAQDVLRTLVGTWEGEVQLESGSYPRTLVITAVGERNGLPILRGEYGGARRGESTPVEIAVDQSSGDVILRFFAESSSITLTLYKDRQHLFGSLQVGSSSGRGRRLDNPIKFTKTSN